jgi:hypothetical protein
MTKARQDSQPAFRQRIPRRYLAAAQEAGLWAAESRGIVFLGSDDHVLVHARTLIDIYERPFDPLSADICFRFSGDRSLAAYGNSLRDQNWIAMMHLSDLPRPAGAPDFAPLMRLAMAGLTAIGQDTQDLQIDATITTTAIDASIVCVARPSSPLEAALVAPPASTAPIPMIDASESLTTLTGTINPTQTGSFASTLMKRIVREQALAIDPEVFSALDLFSRDASGQLAFRVSRDPKHGVRCSYAHGVMNERAGSALATSIFRMFSSDGPLAKASARIGAKIQLQPNHAARESHGVSVDGITASVTDISFSAEEQAAVLAFVRDGELACTDQWLLYAQDPTELDALISRATSSPGTTSVEAAAPTHAISVSCDLAGIVAAAYSMVPKTTAKPSRAFSDLPAGQPMTFTGDFQSGSARWTCHVPMLPIAALVKAAGIAALEEWLQAP